MMRILRLAVTAGALVTVVACGTSTPGTTAKASSGASTLSPSGSGQAPTAGVPVGGVPAGGPSAAAGQPASGTAQAPGAQQPGASAPDPNHVVPDPRAVDLQPVRWASISTGSRNEVDVHYTITGSIACHTLGRVDVAEASQSVTITLRIGHLPDANCSGMQPLIAMVGVTAVTLAQPLGDRAVLDGAATG
jgi:hypothetical protein